MIIISRDIIDPLTHKIFFISFVISQRHLSFTMSFVATRLDDKLMSVFAGVDVIALDVEGVDLCRAGKICLVQLATENECVVIDTLEADTALIDWLRVLLESDTIVKVTHDCRMDSDALFHILHIELVNVHDTSQWHRAITCEEDKNLNAVLMHNGLSPNVVRDSRVYNANHAFWATRPLTPTMLKWASGDVGLLLELRKRQMALADVKQSAMAKIASDANIVSARAMSLTLITVRSPGLIATNLICTIEITDLHACYRSLHWSVWVEYSQASEADIDLHLPARRSVTKHFRCVLLWNCGTRQSQTSGGVALMMPCKPTNEKTEMVYYHLFRSQNFLWIRQ